MCSDFPGARGECKKWGGQLSAVCLPGNLLGATAQGNVLLIEVQIVIHDKGGTVLRAEYTRAGARVPAGYR